MIKRRTKLIGVSTVLIGLWSPFAVQAHQGDDTWLYVAGAVATYAHMNDHAYGYRGHRNDKHWRKHQRRVQWDRKHARRQHRQSHRIHSRRGGWYQHESRRNHGRFDDGGDSYRSRNGVRSGRRHS
jgi:hypothetical protein